uniref:Uncharacterized protein n=1 Tax=Cucumis melo TaxID=3656 RepID=A0A9I9EBE9_CUCME
MSKSKTKPKEVQRNTNKRTKKTKNRLNIHLKKRRPIRLIFRTESISRSLEKEHHEEAKILMTPMRSYAEKLALKKSLESSQTKF